MATWPSTGSSPIPASSRSISRTSRTSSASTTSSTRSPAEPSRPRVTLTSPRPALDPADDRALADHLHQAGQRIRAELGKRIIGQERVVEQSLLALLAGGNCLLVGVPGLAKTLLVQTLAEVLDLSFQRIQFTPDLMPS